MTSDFAPEVANVHKSILLQQQFQECASVFFRSVSDAACFTRVASSVRPSVGRSLSVRKVYCGKTVEWI